MANGSSAMHLELCHGTTTCADRRMHGHGRQCFLNFEDVPGSWLKGSLQGPHRFSLGEPELAAQQATYRDAGTMAWNWRKPSSPGLGWVTSLAARGRRPQVALVSCP